MDSGNILSFFLFLAGMLGLVIWSSTLSKSFSPFQNIQCPRTAAINAPPLNELEAALQAASMANNTIIIAVVNKAYVEGEPGKTMLDIFLESFWLGEDTRVLLHHLLLVTVDQTSYDRCKFRGLHCYRLVTDGVDFMGEKLYMSEDFIKMMWRRTLFLSDVLRLGYNFIFTDTDVMWLRNPFTKIGNNASEDLEISTDRFGGDPRTELNIINTGFYYIRSNNKTISLFDTWYGMKDKSTGKKEQDVLVDLMRQGIFRQLGLRVRFLDTLYFSGFCQDSKDFRAVTTVHANCCRRISAKVADLTTVLREWRMFKDVVTAQTIAGGNETTVSFQWSRHFACINSWRKG